VSGVRGDWMEPGNKLSPGAVHKAEIPTY
jgi:hypothetical protein